MPNEMQFMDCPHCGKRVRTDASRCHRCGQVPALAFNRARDADGVTELDEDQSESHHAVRWGGYRIEEDDFDHDSFIEDEFGESPRKQSKPWWWYVAWVVLGIFALGIAANLWMLYSQS
ncbi:MAG: zinc ribbon domain-containing protein [Pirellula sp.]|jgi:hypothetical protein|nr:zinc ribbon domain-containing protein [Pirellula sp.]